MNKIDKYINSITNNEINNTVIDLQNKFVGSYDFKCDISNEEFIGLIL